MGACEFFCDVCGARAGAVELVETSAGTELRRTSFTSVLTDRLGPASAAVTAAVAAADAAALFALDPEYAPFWCPTCRVPYCGDHWRRRDVFDGDWHDSIRGSCPHGHDRQLED